MGDVTETSLATSYERWRTSTLGLITERIETRVVLALLGPLQGKRVLDVGTGDGTYAIEAATRGGFVTAIDRDPSMLNAARERADNVVTSTLEQLWKDREITVQFSVDADHFDIIVKDKDSNALVPLDERSRGFRWYFSFFVTFAADTQGGDMGNAILLLDEPGLFLHATAQEALLSFFDTLPNQIVYTTHSPFMIEPSALTSVRTVNLDRKTGTVASADPTGDANTLFPLQAALGYNLTQTLFVGGDNVLLEGVTDYWYISAASEFLKDGGSGLEEGVVLTPSGGAGKVGYMVALLTAQKLNVVVVLDSDGAGDDAAKELLTAKLIRDTSIVRVGSVLSPTKEADIETSSSRTSSRTSCARRTRRSSRESRSSSTRTCLASCEGSRKRSRRRASPSTRRGWRSCSFRRWPARIRPPSSRRRRSTGSPS